MRRPRATLSDLRDSCVADACLQVSTGAQNDLEKITQMAYSTVAVYGMNERVGLVSFPPDKQRMDKPYSDDTARLIDQEVRTVVSKCYDRTLELLREKRDAVEALAQVPPLTSGAANALCVDSLV